MVPQHQLHWMGLEVDLPLEVLDLVCADVVAKERDRGDERDEPLAEVLDQLG